VIYMAQGIVLPIASLQRLWEASRGRALWIVGHMSFQVSEYIHHRRQPTIEQIRTDSPAAFVCKIAGQSLMAMPMTFRMASQSWQNCLQYMFEHRDLGSAQKAGRIRLQDDMDAAKEFIEAVAEPAPKILEYFYTASKRAEYRFRCAVVPF